MARTFPAIFFLRIIAFATNLTVSSFGINCFYITYKGTHILVWQTHVKPKSFPLVSLHSQSEAFGLYALSIL